MRIMILVVNVTIWQNKNHAYVEWFNFVVSNDLFIVVSSYVIIRS